MSKLGSPFNPDLPDGLGFAPAPPNGAATLTRRRNAASVTLRQRAGGDQSFDDGLGSFDPATKSLGDALKITYRLLLFAMAVLVVLYIFSGFQSIKESERGIRLLFGRVQAQNLGSGFQISFPAPIGELVKVQTGLQTEEINNAFFPRLTEQEEKQLTDKDKGAQSLADGGADTLDPDSDGQLLTADGNIVHARWSVSYQRTEAWLAAQNINPDFERKIVSAAACRGIVHAASSLTIDDILKKQAETTTGQQVGSSKIELRAKESAQAALNKIESGITIKQIALTLVIPPRKVMRQYEDVQAAQSNKSALVQIAATKRKDTLTQTAGSAEAAEMILSLIDRYERELQLQEKSKAAATLDAIGKVMMNEPVEIDGAPADRISGSVIAKISDARQFRTSIVNQAKGEAAFFEASRNLFDSNPLVMIHGDWSDALRSVFERDNVQAMWLPPGTAGQVIQINPDPRIAKKMEEDANFREAQEAEAARVLKRERKRFEDRTDIAPKMREN